MYPDAIDTALWNMFLLGGDSEREPPDSISNSVVKTLSADDSVGLPHVKVGHCQAFDGKTEPNARAGIGFFFFL